MVVVFYIVSAKAELANSEQMFLGENVHRVPANPGHNILSADQYITLSYIQVLAQQYLNVYH